MLLKVRYQSRIFHRDVGWKSMGDAGLKLFPPSIKPLFYALKTHLFVHFKGRGLATHLFMDFPQYLLTLKHHSPIHYLSTAGSNSSVKARGHVECWVEFHPASLSEGWYWWELHAIVLNLFLISLNCSFETNNRMKYPKSPYSVPSHCLNQRWIIVDWTFGSMVAMKFESKYNNFKRNWFENVFFLQNGCYIVSLSICWQWQWQWNIFYWHEVT